MQPPPRKALQRLAQQFQKKDWHKGKGDVLNSGSVFAVWRSLVEATAHGGASRLGAAEGYRSLTAEALKSLRTASEQRAKRGLERLQQVQGELVDAVRELNKVKKKYCQLGHIASVAREKASDSQARSKKSDHGIFHFRTGLHKVTAKLNARLGECDQRLMEVRNEYLLMLVATNSHHQHYLCTELPAIMKSMDGDLYDQVREQLTLLCHTEIGASQSTQSELARICEDCGQVTREQDLVLFLQESTAFTRTSEFHFQKVPGDTVSGLQHSRTSPEGESCLDKEARKWATKAAKDYKIISHGERALHTLERRRKLLMEDAGSGVELKMEEVKESIRKAQVSRVKAESRLALLASAGVDVDPWVSSAMGQADEELERERRLSEARLSNGDVSSLEDEFEFEDFDENVDIFTESTSGPGVCGYPMPCRVLYSYQGCQADELSITEGEELQVIEDGDMEDWLKARNAAGQVGYVPERYLQFLRPPAEGSAAHEVGGSPRLDSSLNSSESSPGCPTRGQQRASHTGWRGRCTSTAGRVQRSCPSRRGRSFASCAAATATWTTASGRASWTAASASSPPWWWSWSGRVRRRRRKRRTRTSASPPRPPLPSRLLFPSLEPRLLRSMAPPPARAPGPRVAPHRETWRTGCWGRPRTCTDCSTPGETVAAVSTAHLNSRQGAYGRSEHLLFLRHTGTPLCLEGPGLDRGGDICLWVGHLGLYKDKLLLSSLWTNSSPSRSPPRLTLFLPYRSVHYPHRLFYYVKISVCNIIFLNLFSLHLVSCYISIILCISCASKGWS
ncbi:F-BAR and double SH3 domains protein 1-like isoform X2 [Anguilla rostrata]|uniref:F-BAR and double SH3 domains protein 1-like isoform X2 n=1 Tax=Anguilla rostrata TaxID=7938 RepID=UPI0030CFEB19